MPSANDSSVLRRLAISFGKGLAFSFAVKITGDAMRHKPVAPAAPAPAPPSQIDRRAIQAIVGAVEKLLNEHAARVQERIADLESSVTANAGRRIEQEAGTLRAKVASMQRELAQSVAAIVAEHVAEQTSAMEASIQSRIDAALSPLRQEIRELRQRLVQSEKTVRVASERGTAVEEPKPAVTPVPPQVADPVPIRAHATPEHLDLHVQRKRLREVELPAREPRPERPPAFSQPREPASLSPFRAAS